MGVVVVMILMEEDVGSTDGYHDNAVDRCCEVTGNGGSCSDNGGGYLF